MHNDLVEEFQTFIETHGVEILTQKVDGGYLIIKVVARGCLGILKYIVEVSPLGAAILEFCTPDYLITPAFAAAEAGRLEILKYIVDHAPTGAKVLEARNWVGRTPAWTAARYWRLEILQYMAENSPTGRDLFDIPACDMTVIRAAQMGPGPAVSEELETQKRNVLKFLQPQEVC